MNTENTKLAYADIIILDNGGYLGAVLITDQKGFPVEFRYTDPIIPTKIQKVLYGKGIQKYLKVDVILDSLLKILSNNFELLIVSDEELLSYEGELSAPILRISQTKSPIIGEKGALSKIKDTEYLIQTTSSQSPIRVQLREGDKNLSDENAINTMAEFLCNMSDFIDVYEPLSRLKQSIDLICQKDIQ